MVFFGVLGVEGVCDGVCVDADVFKGFCDEGASELLLVGVDEDGEVLQKEFGGLCYVVAVGVCEVGCAVVVYAVRGGLFCCEFVEFGCSHG